METRFHELLVEHGLKMLLKPHSQTSERRGYEAGKKRQDKGKKGGLSVKDRKKVNANHYHITYKRGRGENVSTETRKTEVPPQP